MNTTTETCSYLWDVDNDCIVDNRGFTTIAEVMAYGDENLIHFWKEYGYKIREI